MAEREDRDGHDVLRRAGDLSHASRIERAHPARTEADRRGGKLRVGAGDGGVLDRVERGSPAAVARSRSRRVREEQQHHGCLRDEGLAEGRLCEMPASRRIRDGDDLVRLEVARRERRDDRPQHGVERVGLDRPFPVRARGVPSLEDLREVHAVASCGSPAAGVATGR